MTIKIYCKDKSYVIKNVVTYSHSAEMGYRVLNVVQQDTTTVIYLDKVRMVRYLSGSEQDNIQVEAENKQPADKEVEQNDTDLPLRSDAEGTRILREIFGFETN